MYLQARPLTPGKPPGIPFSPRGGQPLDILGLKIDPRYGKVALVRVSNDFDRARTVEWKHHCYKLVE